MRFDDYYANNLPTYKVIIFTKDVNQKTGEVEQYRRVYNIQSSPIPKYVNNSQSQLRRKEMISDIKKQAIEKFRFLNPDAEILQVWFVNE